MVIMAHEKLGCLLLKKSLKKVRKKLGLTDYFPYIYIII